MITTDKYRTGGYIDAFCTKCDMNLGHTIIAMVGTKVMKVHCNTCGIDHVYRGEERRVKGEPAPKVQKAKPGFEARLKGRSTANARKYTPKEHFKADEIIFHPSFGIGIVTADRGNKIDIIFQNSERTLVNGPA
jgi:hypothetical protein